MTPMLGIRYDFDLVWENRDLLWDALLVTLRLFALTLALSVIPGLAVAAGRTYGPRPVRALLTAVVYMVRAVPAVLVVLIVYFALPFVGPTLDAFTSVLLTLTIVQVAYFSEVFRGSLLAVDRGQLEAAQALGLRWRVAFVRVILPQAALVAAPAFVSSCVQLMQNTTIASGVALYDLLGRAQNIAVTSLEGSPVIIVSLVYVVMLVPFVRLARRLERRVARRMSLSPLAAADLTATPVLEPDDGEPVALAGRGAG